MSGSQNKSKLNPTVASGRKTVKAKKTKENPISDLEKVKLVNEKQIPAEQRTAIRSRLRKPKYITHTVSTSLISVDEGMAVMFTYATNGPNGTYYWTNGGTTNANDFMDGVNNGSFMVASGIGTVVKTLSNDLLTEGSETAIFEVRTNSLSGSVVASGSVVINDTSVTEYEIDSSLVTVNEGSSITFTFTTTGPDGVFYWTNSGTVSGSDFSDGFNSGSFSVIAGTGSVSRTLSADVATEGGETIIFEVRANSESGPILATKSITVNDTSIAQYSLSSLTAGYTLENTNQTFSFRFTTNAPDGTFYWTNSGTATGEDFTDGVNSGSFVTTNGTGSISRTVVWDVIEESTETFKPQVRIGSITGTIVATGSRDIYNTTWSPTTTTIPDLVAYYTIQSGLSYNNTTKVLTSWSDSSGNGHTLTTHVGGAVYDISNTGGVLFNGNTRLLNSNININLNSSGGDMTIVFIGRMTTWEANKGIAAFDNLYGANYTRNLVLRTYSSSPEWGGHINNGEVTTYSNNSPTALKIRVIKRQVNTGVNLPAAGLYTYENGTLLQFAAGTGTLPAYDNAKTKRFMVGALAASSTESRILVYQIMLINRAITDTELAKLSSYANRVYGI